MWRARRGFGATGEKNSMEGGKKKKGRAVIHQLTAMHRPGVLELGSFGPTPLGGQCHGARKVPEPRAAAVAYRLSASKYG